MKKIFFSTVIAALALTSCGSNVQEEVLSDNLVKVTTTVDGKTVKGVKTVEGQELVPAQYEKIDLFGQYIMATTGRDVYLYTQAGKKLLDTPVSMLSDYDSFISLYGDGQTFYVFKGNDTVAGPFVDAADYQGFIFASDGKVSQVLNMQGVTLLTSEKIVMLFSNVDVQQYLIGINGDAAKAFDMEGQYMYDLDITKLEKLPRASWRCGDNMTVVTTRNKLEAFKVEAKAPKAKAKASKKK